MNVRTLKTELDPGFWIVDVPFQTDLQWNPDFSNLQGKRKLVRKIEGDIKLRLIGQVLFDYEYR